MKLLERDGFLSSLQTQFKKVAEGEGHCVFISGEAGIGKTALINAFCREQKENCNIYQGTCDALFSPRPLAPLYDIVWQMRSDLWENKGDIADRSELFTSFFHKLGNQKEVTVILIEDIHWADEATLDFIKFLARRITQLRCLFILTYRDNQIHSLHPLRNVLGHLNPDTFTRVQLPPLSRQAVEKMAVERGYSGEDVYSVSGGNPFYVNEILASYSPGIPDNIKDSILSVYNLGDEKAKQVWQVLSILPTGFEMKYLEKLEPFYAAEIENCVNHKILISKGDLIFFKHELYRRTIESSLSPFVRISLNKKILDTLLESFEQNQEIERIIHHAKNANQYELVVKYAPLAAKKAASVGAHVEASKLYLTAIEYYQGNDKDMLIQFYESYAYECYLTNQIKEAIIYEGKALNILKEKNDIEKTGNSMRFLSRLCWYDGNRKKAETYANSAIEVLSSQSSSRVKAMAFSNMSQLKMLSDHPDECISWGEKAIEMAKELADDETLSHALNNVGVVQMRIRSARQRGIELLQQSLEIALKNSFDEPAARSYTNLVINAVEMNDYPFAERVLEEGIQYCEERDLDSFTSHLLAYKARLKLETGKWNEAYRIADNLIKNEDQTAIVKIWALIVLATIKMRRGEGDFLPFLLEAKEKAFETMESTKIIPALIALLEYEWITETRIIEKADLDSAIPMVEQTSKFFQKNEFVFWFKRARKQQLQIQEFYEGFRVDNTTEARNAARLWEQIGCPYEQALTLFEGDEADKRKAIAIVHQLGATDVYEKMKLQMRTSGIKSIPRGIRRSTQANPAQLTVRELDVLQLLKEGFQNKEIASRLFISPKTVDHHISSILFKLDVDSRTKAVRKASQLGVIK
ncbi:MAG TPA: AAA family ATPase [Chitinophagaceae bacterium]|nr:AAA family ATPase [Chitinophagaceae bacterium]